MAENKNDLGWLSDVKPSKTQLIPTRRGRQPGSNPMETHVQDAYKSGETMTISASASVAKRVERLIRRVGTRNGWSVSVQVLNADPNLDSTGPDNVIPLNELENLAENADVWVSYSAEDKPEKPEKTGETPDAEADPFAGQPDASTGETIETAKTEDKPRGRKRTAA